MRVTYKNRSAEFDPRTLAFSPITSFDSSDGGESIVVGHLDRAPERRAAYARGSMALPPGSVAPGPGEPTSWRRSRYLHRLVLNVANYCNLDCVYCYAQGGDYGGPKEKLGAQVAARVFHKFYDLYDTIHSVMFFGGEPLLNIDLIEQLCENGWDIADRLGRERPVYTMISNGTLISDRAIRLVKAYGIKMTVSLDGPPAVNDRLRPRKGGEASTRKVEENIRALKEATGQPGQIEGTFTNLHAELGISVRDVLDYVLETLDVNSVHLPVNVMGAAGRRDAYAVRPEHLDWVAANYADAVEATIDSLLSRPVAQTCLLAAAVDLIKTLTAPSPPPPFICPAGTGTIAVDSNGDVYPCFMFYRQRAYKFGSVLSEDAPAMADAAQYKFLGRLEPDRIPTVSASWASRFMNGCAGGNYFKSGDHGSVAADEIQVVESMAGAAVVELAHLRADPGLWDYLPHAIRLHNLYTAIEHE